MSGKSFDVPGCTTNKFNSKVENIVLSKKCDVNSVREKLKRNIIILTNEVLKVEIIISRLCHEDRFLIEQKFFADKSVQGWKAIAREHSKQFNKEYVLSWKTIKWRVKNKIIPFLDSLL